MKIISRGVDPRTLTYQATCNRCKTVVEFTRDDPEVKYNNDQRDGDYLSCSCPVCADMITVQVRRPK
jgi:hypothetical protein